MQQVKDLDKNIVAYGDKFVWAMSNMRKDVQIQIAAPSHDTGFDGRIDPLASFPREELALTYEEVKQLEAILSSSHPELLLCEDKDHSVWKTVPALKRMLNATSTGASLDKRITCEASIRRLVKVVAFQIMIRPMKPFSEDE